MFRSTRSLLGLVGLAVASIGLLGAPNVGKGISERLVTTSADASGRRAARGDDTSSARVSAALAAPARVSPAITFTHVGRLASASDTVRFAAINLQSTHAYLNYWSDQELVSVVDIRDEDHPVVVATVRVTGTINSIVAIGTTAYVGTGDTSDCPQVLYIIDASMPMRPQLSSFGPFVGCVSISGVDADLLFVKDRRGTHVVDASDRLQPRALSLIKDRFGPLVAVEDRLYFYSQTSVQGGVYPIFEPAFDLTIYDIYSPSFPSLRGHFHEATDYGTFKATNLLSGFRFTPERVQVLDLFHPDNPKAVEVQSIENAIGQAAYGPNAPLDAFFLTFYPDRKDYPAEWFLHVINIANTKSRRIADQMVAPGELLSRRFDDELAVGLKLILVPTSRGLRTFDWTERQHPRLVSVLSQYDMRDVAVDGTTAYLADGLNGLSALDLTTPQTPTLASKLPVTGTAQQVALWDGGLVVGTNEGDLYGFRRDASAALAPVWSSHTPGSVQEIAASGDLILVADGHGSLRVYRRACSTAVEVGSIATAGYARDVFASGHMAYVAAWDEGLLAIDLIDPTHPRLVSRLPVDGYATSVGGNDRTVLVGRSKTDPMLINRTELWVVDVTNPAQPNLESKLDLPTTTWDIDVRGPLAFLANGSEGVQVIDIADPDHPTWLKSLMPVAKGNGFAWGLAATDDSVVLALEAASASVLQYEHNLPIPAPAGSPPIDRTLLTKRCFLPIAQLGPSWPACP